MKNHFVEHFKELKTLGKEYIDLHFSLAKIESMEKLSGIITFLLLSIIAVSFFSIIIFLLGVAFALWFADVAGTMAQGILIYTGVLILILIFFYAFRKSLLINPIIRKFNTLFFDEHKIKDHKE